MQSRTNPLIWAATACFLGELMGTTSILAADESPVAIETGTVEVVATTPLPGFGLPKDQIPSAVQTVKADDMARTQSLDITDFISRSLTGVHVNEVQGNPVQPDINYRGFTASPLLGTPQGLSLYMDGVRLNQPFGDVVSWDLIPRNAIASMQLMPGSNPLFGLNTLGGALSLQTKNGRDFPGGAIQLTYGSNARKIGEFEVGGAKENVDWYVAGTAFDEDGWRDHSESKYQQLFGKLGLHGTRTDLILSYAFADTDLNGNGLVPRSFLNRDYASVYTWPDNTKNKSDFINAQLSHELNDDVSFSGNAYYRKIRTRTFNGDINDNALPEGLWPSENGYLAGSVGQGVDTRYTTGWINYSDAAGTIPRDCLDEAMTAGGEPGEKCNAMINRSRIDQENFGLFGQISIRHTLMGQPGRAILGGGYDGSRADFSQSSEYGWLLPDRGVLGTGFFADGTGVLDGVPDDSRVDLKSNTETWSVYGTDTLALAENLHLTGSFRYNHTKINNRDNLVEAPDPNSLTGDHNFHRLNPAIGVTFSPANALTTYLSYSEASRAPTAIELGCANPDNACRLPNAMAGDPALKQVVSKTIELGARGRLPAAAWSASLFSTQNVHDIQFISAATTGLGYFDNVAKTKRRGFEAAFATSLGDLSLGANYTYLLATYGSDHQFTSEANSSAVDGIIEVHDGDSIPLIPRHNLKVFANYQLTSKFAFGGDIQAISSSFVRGNENNAHQADGETYFGDGKIGGYSILNFMAKYQVEPSIQVFARVNNVFDREYATAGMLGASAFNPSTGAYALVDRDANRHYTASYGETFVAPGAPRSFWVGLRWTFGGAKTAAADQN